MPSGAEYYFSYQPANIAPEAAAGIFIGIAAMLIVQGKRAGAPKWLLILPTTAVAEAIGYVFRTICIYKTTLATFTAMTLFLLLPPNALALLNYKTLGETVRLSNTQPRHFWLKPRFVTWFFFTSDVFSFLLQAGGVALSTRDGMREVAKKTILCGLAVQLLFFGAFFLIAMYVRNCAYYVVAKGPHDVDGIQAKARLMRTILSTTLLLYGRSVYRVIEFAGGYGSKVYGTEWMFYAFDTVIIMICFAVYIQSYLGHHFNGRSAIGEEHSLAELYVYIPQPHLQREQRADRQRVPLPF